MEKPYHGLIAALAPGPKEHVAVVGGGGKSTLCLALAEALVKDGAKVVSSTTTKVRETETTAYPRLLLFSFGEVEEDSVSAELDDAENVFVGRQFIENDKIEGISAAEADRLFSLAEADYLVIEADGAAGLPLKTPAAHEPVIPGSSTMVIAVMGLSALDKPVGPESVFRQERFTALTGINPGETISPRKLVNAFDETAGLFKNAPPAARRVAFLNQLDTVSDHQTAFDLARSALKKHSFIERVVLGSLQRDEFITLQNDHSKKG